MKWPETLAVVRHAESEFNSQKKLRDESHIYKAFKDAYEKDPDSDTTVSLAKEVVGYFPVLTGDHQFTLSVQSMYDAELMAKNLKVQLDPPNIIFVSPYQRTYQTLEIMQESWPELKNLPTKEEERIRERDHGLALMYGDWKVFSALNPEQRALRELQGEYWYRYPQGENIPDVRERIRSWMSTLSRDYSGQSVLAITHHLAILSLRANIERLSASEVIRLDHNEKPINCGVTVYKGDSNQGRNGRLILDRYNARLH